MLTLSIETEPGMARTIVLDEFPCRIGRHRSHPVVLSSWRVARTHAEIRRTGERYAIADLGSLGGTAVNGERVNEYGPLLEGDEIVIGGFLLRVLATEPSPGGTDAARSSGTTPTQSRSGACPAPDDAPLEARRLLHRRLLAQIDLRRHEIRHLEATELRARLRGILEEIIAGDPAIVGDADPARLIEALIDEAIGLGPLEALLGDDTISEIMVNGADQVFVERSGRRRLVMSACSASLLGRSSRSTSSKRRQIAGSSACSKFVAAMIRERPEKLSSSWRNEFTTRLISPCSVASSRERPIASNSSKKITHGRAPRAVSNTSCSAFSLCPQNWPMTSATVTWMKLASSSPAMARAM